MRDVCPTHAPPTRHLQAHADVHGGVPEQVPHRALRVKDVPPEQCAEFWCFLLRADTHPSPAVYADGGICLDILQNNWSPIYDVSAVLTSIQSLLCDPNPNSPANSEAARMYVDDRREYDKRVAAVVEGSWTDAAGEGPAPGKR